MDAADGCDCGAKYQVRVSSLESDRFGEVEWRINHREDCYEIEEDYVDGHPVTEISCTDVAGWEFMDKPVDFRGLELYPLKSRVNIGPCLICWKLIIRAPLILFIDGGKGGQLDFCFACAEEQGILRDMVESAEKRKIEEGSRG